MTAINWGNRMSFRKKFFSSFFILFICLTALHFIPAQAYYPYGLAIRPARMLYRMAKNKNKQKAKDNKNANDFMQAEIGGLNVAIWKPHNMQSSAPLVIFSHGFGGINTQSKFIMQALANAGYLVMAPNHQDSFANSLRKEALPEVFRHPAAWNDNTYKNRAGDIIKLLDALKSDPVWSGQINWSKVALCGHSLGGYTVLGLGGAWPNWKQPGISAILALSPYCEPFVLNGNLENIGVPVMYQGCTKDLGITPTIKNLRGALAKTSSPAEFVEFDKLGHFGWTNYNKNKKEQKLINYYCVAFFDKYVKGDQFAQPDLKYPGVSNLEIK